MKTKMIKRNLRGFLKQCHARTVIYSIIQNPEAINENIWQI